MSDVLNKMKTRRSIRNFKSNLPPQDMLDQIIEAGTYAASAMNTQNTIIIQVTNPELRSQIVTRNCEIGGWKEGFDPFYGAPVILIVLAKKDWANRVYDGSLVMGNLMLAAGPKKNLKRNGDRNCCIPWELKKNMKESAIAPWAMSKGNIRPLPSGTTTGYFM